MSSSRPIPLSSPTEFVSRELEFYERDRFNLFGDLVAGWQWWHRLLEEGCIIAGGSAVFILQKSQCVGKVGDVDVWVPGGCGERLGVYIADLVKWLKEKGVKFGVRIQPSIVTVWNDSLSVQFIKTIEKKVEDILVGFDYDYVQCAVRRERLDDVSMDPLRERGEKEAARSGKYSRDRLWCTMSKACVKAHETLTVSYENKRLWRFQGLDPRRREDVQRTRLDARRHKFEKKGFSVSAGNASSTLKKVEWVEWHKCEASHRPLKDSMWNKDHNSASDCATTYINELPREAVSKINGIVSRQMVDIVRDYEHECAFKSPTTFGDRSEPSDWTPIVVYREPFNGKRYLADLKRFEEMSEHNSTNQKLWFGVRNLKLLFDPNISLDEVNRSIQSDTLKVCDQSRDGRSAKAFGMGVDMLLRMGVFGGGGGGLGGGGLRDESVGWGGGGTSSLSTTRLYETILEEFFGERGRERSFNEATIVNGDNKTFIFPF